uniref:Uncharacterized protein n=1 Tax=Strigamia maritima TaxID=126957 RepID=T1INI4_STRMM
MMMSRRGNGNLLQQLEKILLDSPPSPQLIVGFKQIFADLVSQLSKLEKENAHLEHTFKRDKETHKKHLQQLEDEMEKQVKQLKESVYQQLKQESDAENRALRAQLEAEKAELQAQLSLFQTFGNHLKHDQGEQTERMRAAHSKLEDAHQDNRQLRINLAEMQTNVAVLRSDVAQLRTQYEDKCKELHKEKEVVFEYMHEHDHLTRQLHLLHEANKRLQDLNDHLRGSMDAAQLYRQMQTFRKTPLLRDTSMVAESETNMDEITFGLKRFMEDIDSGMSTMREDNHSEDEDHNKSRNSLPSFEPLTTSTPLGFSSLQNPERTFKVVFAGDANVGKSTFILHVSKGVFVPTVSSTL